MSSFNLKSTIITNRDATPKVITDAYISGGDIRESEGFVQSGSTTDAIGSTYRLCMIPSNARVSSLDFQSDNLGSGSAVNVGVYYPTFIPVGSGLAASNASAAIAASCFVSAQSTSGAVAATNLITRANVAINLQEQPLWQLAGLASDPGIDLDIVVTVSAILAAQGYVSLKARYVF